MVHRTNKEWEEVAHENCMANLKEKEQEAVDALKALAAAIEQTDEMQDEAHEYAWDVEDAMVSIKSVLGVYLNIEAE